MTNARRSTRRDFEDKRGFTLLEILLVLALTAVILAGLSSTIRLFSRHYIANERRVGRAQLARSISQILSDDLGAAVQDPIQNVVDDPTRDYVRHFGLRGDSRSLQIDVVQPNLFATVADAEENRRVANGADKSLEQRQAPELKTVFYEFVPINEPMQRVESIVAPSTSSSNDADFGLSGSLSSAPSAIPTEDEELRYDFWDGFTPLKRKYGLSRRELDYETPEDESEEEDSSNAVFDPTTGESGLAGSLTQPPSLENSTLASGAGEQDTEEKIDEDDFNSPLTAAQIAMDSDDGVSWAPEVLDCRFSYFDGQNWLDAWDSLEKNGLPLAIKVELKLAALDDVDLFRESPLLAQLPLAPKLDAIANATNLSDSEPGGSSLSGSLTEIASNKGDPVDVFNTFRPLYAYRQAAIGVTTNVATRTNSPFNSVDDSSLQNALATSDSIDANPGASDDLTDMPGLGGGLNSIGGDANASDSLGGTLGAGEEGSFEERAQQLENAGVVYNAAGICVDFANDGSYMTLEQIADELGVAQPIVYEVISYLPTTPYSRAKVIERRRPATVAPGGVNVPGRQNAAVGRRGGDRANPYASGQARAPRERTVNERTARERNVNERNVATRGPNQRNAAERNFGERTFNERGANNRQARDRNATERVVTQRNVRERNVGTGVGGVEFDPSGAPLGVETPGGPSAGGTANRSEQGRNPSATPTAATPGGGLAGGGLAGGGLGGAGLGGANSGANAFSGLDPFAIVNDSTSSAPFAEQSSPFDELNSALGATATTPGLVESSSGFDTVVTPNPSTPPRQTTNQKNQQTWIRGKK